MDWLAVLGVLGTFCIAGILALALEETTKIRVKEDRIARRKLDKPDS